MDYVSSQYYPPEKTMQDVVRQILLSSEVQQEVQRDAYMLLMKIQAYVSHVLPLCLVLSCPGLLVLIVERELFRINQIWLHLRIFSDSS